MIGHIIIGRLLGTEMTGVEFSLCILVEFDSPFMVKVCDYIVFGKKIPSRIDSSALYE